MMWNAGSRYAHVPQPTQYVAVPPASASGEART